MENLYFRVWLKLDVFISLDELAGFRESARNLDCELWLDPQKEDENAYRYLCVVLKSPSLEIFQQWQGEIAAFFELARYEVIDDFDGGAWNFFDMPITAMVDELTMLNLGVKFNKERAKG
jgi:hypothetical protein